MIYKSYLVEENINIFKNNIVLFYGENLGLIEEFKQIILKDKKKESIIKFTQEDILGDPNNFFNEINSNSLFNDKKFFFISNVNDKLLKIAEEVLLSENNNLIYFFSNTLEKKSKIRSFFEKEKKVDIVPCYQDNELTLKKKTIVELRNYVGLDTAALDLIVQNCSQNRSKLKNEINKIKVFFKDKKIKFDDLKKLLNLKEDDDFSLLRDTALGGDTIKTNKLLDSTEVESEKSIFYISILNNRFNRLKEICRNKINLENSVNNLKPPIFWKDKPDFIRQAKLWNIEKLNNALSKTYEVELKLKTNSFINKRIIFKKLIVDICNLANAA